MFSHLVESGSHAADLKRRGSFFAGALAFYGLLLAAAGVGSVYAFNAHLDAQSDYEVYAILRFQPAEERSEPPRPEAPRPAAANSARQIATAPEIAIDTPYRPNRIASASTRVVSARTPIIIAPFESEAVPGGLPFGPNSPGGPGHAHAPGGDGPRVIETTPPPAVPVRPAPTPAPPRKPDGPLRLTTYVINSKAITKPVPAYPPIARQARIEGAVAVLILVDEEGRVTSARATSGHPLLQHAAAQAARQARFTPTLLNGQPVRVSGVITYNFTLQ
jgi:protein TonB